MKNRLKKSLLVLILSLVALILGATKASAVWISYGDLAGSYNLYCVQHGQYMNGTYDYQVVNTVTITGRTAKDSSGRTTTNSSNAILAYILGGGNYRTGYSYGGESYTERQNALWGYINTWIANNGASFGLANFEWWGNGSYDTYITTEARNYAQNASDNSPAAIKSNTPSPVITSNAYAGPFNVTYSGSVKSIVVKDKDGNQITSGLSYYNKKGEKITSIKSGKDFYIKNESGKQLKQLSIDVESNQTIRAAINFLKSSYEGGPQRLIYVEANPTTTKAHIDINIKTYGDLVIKKVDAKTKNAIDGVEFKIKTSKGWLQKTNSGYKYDQTFEKATAFKTANGKGITLKDLQLGTYHVYETNILAEGYDITLQEGYKSDKGWVDFGTAKIDGSTQEVTKTYINYKSISIKGYVWVDIPLGKQSDTNSKYDSSESGVAGVKVRLINKGTGKAVKISENQDYVETDGNGNYAFKNKVTEATIKNYYVEFDYSGVEQLKRKYIDANGKEKSHINYIPVAFNSKYPDQIVKNGSRAIVNSMQEKDVDIKGIATTYKGTDDEETYGLSGNLFEKLYEPNEESLNNINLGLKELPATDYTIEQDIEYVDINMKGYNYRYKFGAITNTNSTAVPTVRWREQLAYSKKIYPSDIAYDKEKSTQELKVTVTYRIDIKNTTNLTDESLRELYQEEKLVVDQLINTYDTNRYVLDKKDNRWDDPNDTGTATIRNDYLKQSFGDGIIPNDRKTAYIVFEVKHKAIEQILTNLAGISEDEPTKATAVAYHKYNRDDYSWSNKDMPQNQSHQTTVDVRSAVAPYLIFQLGEQRHISGKVFKDEVITTDGQKLGNGQYDNEDVVEGVKVELLDVLEGESDITKLPTSHLYGVNEDKTTYTRTAETTTNAKGEYTLAGVVPGDYYLRFTYGDGSQKIYDQTGKEIKVNQVKAKDYKSTIISKEDGASPIREAILNGNKVEATKHTWYKELNKNSNYSVAVDSMESRKALYDDNMNYKDGEDAFAMAATPSLSVTVENGTVDNTDQEGFRKEEDIEKDSGTTLTNNDGEELKVLNDDSTIKNIFSGFHFGIITEPEQKVDIEKIVSNVKLTNAQNNLVFDGNPATAGMKGVSDLSGGNEEGSAFVRAEIEEQSIYGSTLELTYRIQVTNKSDVNYYGEKYYWFGDSTDAYEVTLKVNEVTDYLDGTLQLAGNTDGSKTFTEDGKVEPTEENPKQLAKILITGWDTLYTTENKQRNKEVKTSDVTNIRATRVLSSEDDDMEIINEAQITDASNDSEPEDKNVTENIKTISAIELPPLKSKAVVTVTPPTGRDMQSSMLYIITGAIALVVLATGVVVIKKKVL